ncbi:MAG: mprB [Acidimicrobiales bacterium]|nr:mprB [Acidimicrobiales bacterium]
MSLRWQIGLALAVIAAAVGSAAGLGAYLTTERELRRSVDQSLTAVAARVGNQPGGPGGHGGPDPGSGGSDAPTCPDAADVAPATDVKVVDASGSVTNCVSSADGSVAVPDHAPAGFRTVRVSGSRYRVLVADTSRGSVQVARSLSEDDDVLARLRLRLAALVAAGVAVALLAGWALARGITRPIVRLRHTAEAIATTGDLATPIPDDGRGEVGSLGRSLTSMVHALAMSRDQQRRLVDDASHEMRTPLTSLTTNLEHLENLDRIPAEERREVLDAVQVDVAELTNLLTELVELATDRADDEELELLSLAAVARDVAQRSGRRSGRAIELHSSDDHVLVSARPHLIERTIANLLDNAVKYTPADSPIELDVAGGRLEVRDRGPGIDASDRDRVFDRFYRATTARTLPGSGLGLAIVREVVEGLGGTVWATARTDGPGAAVGFELPVPDPT